MCISLQPWSAGKYIPCNHNCSTLWLSTEANLLRSYSALTDEVFKESNKPDAKQRMVCDSWKSRGKFQRNVGNFRVTVV